MYFPQHLNIVRSTPPNAYAEDDTNVDTTEAVAGVEERGWEDGDQSDDQMNCYKDHFGFQVVWVEDFMILKNPDACDNS